MISQNIPFVYKKADADYIIKTAPTGVMSASSDIPQDLCFPKDCFFPSY